MSQADVDDGCKEGLNTSEKEKLSPALAGERVLRMERGVLKKAAVFFAQEKDRPLF